ncbi:MAG: porin family protein [Gemmataceae bacterium]|nr:porin family protein [Gemmataceae bacterium]
MKRRFLFGMMLSTFIPLSVLAQTPGSGERLLREAATWEVRRPEPLPVTFDDDDWVAKVTEEETSVRPATRVEEALRVTVRGQSQELPPADAVSGSVTSAPVYAGVGTTHESSCGSCNNCWTPPQNGFGSRIRSRVQSVIGTTGPIREWFRCFEPTVYHRGTMSIEFGSNYWRSPIYVESALDTRMVPLNTRFGIMLNEPCRFERLKGVFELMGEVDTIPIVWGGGSIIVGGSGILRYHLVRNHRLVPYVHAGFGGIWTDSAGFANSPTTSNFNFMFQVASGSHIFLTKKWALFSETSYTMIHHLGIGAGPGYHVLGGLAGITRYFGGSDCCRR